MVFEALNLKFVLKDAKARPVGQKVEVSTCALLQNDDDDDDEIDRCGTTDAVWTLQYDSLLLLLPSLLRFEQARVLEEHQQRWPTLREINSPLTPFPDLHYRTHSDYMIPPSSKYRCR